MDQLPQLVYDEISSFLHQEPDYNIAALATVSGPWHEAVERHTFREIRVRSNDLDRFENIVHAGRRRLVSVINYIVILPSYPREARRRFERDDDRTRNDEAFSTAIHCLFQSLKTWDAHQDGYITLRLEDVHSISDRSFLCRSSLDFQGGDAVSYIHQDDDFDLWAWRWRYSYLRLSRPSELPALPVVDCFSTAILTRHICDRVPIDIATRLPSLRVVDWSLNDWGIPYITLRREHRHDLTQAVAHVLPQLSTLQSLNLHVESTLVWTPSISVGTQLPGETVDPLSEAIRTATGAMTSLRDLKISGTVDASLFSPGPSNALAEPFWLNLEHLEVQFEMGRPSGGQYFRDRQREESGARRKELTGSPGAREPPGYASTEEEDIEVANAFFYGDHLDFEGLSGMPRKWDDIVPDGNSLEPLIEGFGRACLKMPSLKSAALFTIIPVSPVYKPSGSWFDRSPWGVWYFSPGTRPAAKYLRMHPAFTRNHNRRRLCWDCKGWFPGWELVRLMRKVGADEDDEGLVESRVHTSVPIRSL